ncbi:MAG TPA: aconitase X catalytic domain-containing protein [Syntrophorhabdaceae bacterium]|nr:aconitase X catalytic domain-containing protein [Syntrophorhabdaceae bacterium]
MYLRENEIDLIEGKYGRGPQRCMEILTAVGECYDAERMVPVTSVHIAGNYGNIRDGGLQWLEDLVRDGGRVKVFTTKNPEMFDFEDADELPVPEIYREKQKMMDDVLRALGVTLTYSCHHYLVGNVPRFGDHIAWASSGSGVYANSIIGARSNRDGDHTVIAAAVTGVIPEYGLHLSHNRKGQVIIKTDNLNIADYNHADFQAMAWELGKKVRDRIPVFDDLPPDIVIQNLKAILYTLTVTGTVGLVHFVGVTPEAPTIEAACGGDAGSLEKISITQKDVEQAYREISSSSDEKVDLVIFGCPQCSIQEIGEVVDLLEGKKIHSETQLWICTSNWVKTLCKRMGYLEKIKAAGGRIVADIGAADGPHIYLRPQGVRVIAINSARGSYYSHNSYKMETWFGSTKACVQAAIAGKWRGYR